MGSKCALDVPKWFQGHPLEQSMHLSLLRCQGKSCVLTIFCQQKKSCGNIITCRQFKFVVTDLPPRPDSLLGDYQNPTIPPGYLNQNFLARLHNNFAYIDVSCMPGYLLYFAICPNSNAMIFGTVVLGGFVIATVTCLLFLPATRLLKCLMPLMLKYL